LLFITNTMKKYLLLLSSCFFVAVLIITCRPQPQQTPIEQAKAWFIKDLDTLEHLINVELTQLAERSNNQDSLQAVFLKSRLQYKKIEHFAEYFFPTTSRLVNGPPLPEYELEENKSFEPGGLQVIEEHLFPFDTASRAELVREIKKLQPELRRYRELWEATEFTEAHLFDAVRLQLFRNISLGISGFDTPLCKSAAPELSVSLQALHQCASLFKSSNADAINRLFEEAIVFAAKNPDFDTFDRLTFITEYANPLTAQLLAQQKELKIVPFTELRALRGDVGTLFDKNAFDPNYYTGNADLFGSDAKVALGKTLFYDTKLSASNNRSCATCHQPQRAFTDGLPKSLKLGGGNIERNAPTILYAALQQRQFHDQRANSLEVQTQDVIQNRDEMHGSLPEACNVLQKDAKYMTLFRQAFPDLKQIEPKHVMNALASYERSLMPFNSRFDQYMRGKRAMLTDSEKRGFNLFMGKAKCGICHFMPLFNGTVPPSFAKSESEVIGVMTAPRSRKIDPDEGKGFNYPTLPDLKYAFKTPTVRNIELTAPYMHNGAYKTLEDVIDFYDHGGAVGLGMDLPNQTLPSDKLNLNAQEKADIVAFMKALTDSEYKSL
jgi:cytochrome c peroxidase